MTGIEACFTGLLGRDAEMRHVKGGTMPLLTFTAAVEERIQSDDAPTVWVRVVAFNDLAEQMADRLAKGVKVYVEGRLTADLWQPDDGRAPRVNIQVVANVLQPLGQIGRRLPTRGQRRHDRARGAGRAQEASAAVLREAGRDRTPEPPQGWVDDSEAAIRDLTDGACR
jgi:single stranded DNA-binding protein